MPIRFSCAKCQKSFTVADSSAGKQGRCKDCGHLNRIPDLNDAESPTDSSKPNTPATYEVTSAINGAVFGPADQKTLRQWVGEKRVTANCQIKKVGTEKWLPAKQFFPQLAPAAVVESSAAPLLDESAREAANSKPDAFANFKTGGSVDKAAQLSASNAANPYAVASSLQKQLNVSDEIVPTTGNLGFIINHAFSAFKSNMGIMIGGFVIYVLTSIVAVVLFQSLGFILAEVGLVIGGILYVFVVSYLGAGIMNLSLKVGREGSASLEDLFSVGDRILPLLGFGLLVGIGMFFALFIVGFLSGVVSLALGPEAQVIATMGSGAVILGIFLVAGFLLWPCYFLIVDRKTKLIQSFVVGSRIGRKNILQFLALYIISLVIFYAGFLLIGIGALISGPLALLIISCGYLNMSGQIRQ